MSRVSAIAVAIFVAGTIVISADVVAACSNSACRPERNTKTGLTGAVWVSIPSSLSMSDQTAFLDGIEMWNDYFETRNAGVQFYVTTTGPSQIQIVIDPNDQGGGANNATDANGFGEIRVSPTYLNRNMSSFWTHLIAHELGHSVGYQNNWGANCSSADTLMYGNISTTSTFLTSLTACDTEALNLFYEAVQTNPPTPNDDNGNSGDECDPITGANCSPILIDLNNDGYSLSGTEPPVLFDLNANGRLEAISWTRMHGDEAFLWLDHNDDGLANDGSELFGNVGYRHGFEKLAMYDTPAAGGNGDGAIDSLDAVWRVLLLWNDLNRNGVTEPGERISLGSTSVRRLFYECQSLRRRDRHGNLFKYRSWLEYQNGDVTMRSQVYDVFFQVLIPH